MKLKNQLLTRNPAKHLWEPIAIETEWVKIIRAVATALLKVPDLLPRVLPAIMPREKEAVRALIARQLGEITQPSNLPSIHFRERSM